VKAGTVYGATDELGYRSVENVVNVHDLHATMLALMGIEHTRLTVKAQGLDVRLTGIAGKQVKGIMA
jgi:arylsulfatase A-like enzyme